MSINDMPEIRRILGPFILRKFKQKETKQSKQAKELLIGNVDLILYNIYKRYIKGYLMPLYFI